MVVLTFALTVHETQGQTLRRIILLLGRLPGMNVGKITWPLLYVALSRTKKLSHIKLFPTGSTKYYHSMYFAHLLKLSMPINFKKWLRSYVDHSWDRNVLRNEHIKSVRKVEKRLELLGEEKTKRLKWIELKSFVKQMGYKATTRDRKMALFCILKEHMVKRLLWKTSKDLKPAKRTGDRRRKRTAQVVETESSEESKSSLRPAKRLRGSTGSKNDNVLRRSTRNRSSRKRSSTFLDLPLTIPRQADNLRRAKEKRLAQKHRKSDEKCLLSQPLHAEQRSSKGLDNLGNTCYFNSIVQCLLHCSLFRDAIENVPQRALSVAVLRELRLLFNQMTSNSASTHVRPSQCFSAAMNIPECKEAQMSLNENQEDAGEFFIRLIEHFRQKFRPLADIFVGLIRSTLTCQQCSNSYIKVDPFKLLSLSFPVVSNEQDPYNVPHTHNIYNLLGDFVKPEIISGYNCPHCAAQRPTEKILHILSTPKVLVLQLKRFSGLEKIYDFVRFPSDLTLKYVNDGNDADQSYRLTGVVLHTGPSIEDGHYIAYVSAEGKWLKANDSTIQEVRWETVRNKKVYLLFYMRL